MFVVSAIRRGLTQIYAEASLVCELWLQAAVDLNSLSTLHLTLASACETRQASRLCQPRQAVCRYKIPTRLSSQFSSPTPRSKNRNQSSHADSHSRVTRLHTQLWEKVPGQPALVRNAETRRHRSILRLTLPRPPPLLTHLLHRLHSHSTRFSRSG